MLYLPFQEFYKHPGRQWLNQFLFQDFDAIRYGKVSMSQEAPNKCRRFVDTFRYFHPEENNAFTCWSTVTGARATNYGTRIDYILADTDLTRSFTDCIIMPDVEGSDHCPVKGDINIDIIPSKKPPPLCSKYMPEFAGRQQKLSSFFTKKSSIEQKSSGSDTRMVLSQVSSKQETTSTSQSKDTNKASLKRTNSGSDATNNAKKFKSSGSKSALGKQGSLLSFFKKSNIGANTVTTSKEQSVDQANEKNKTAMVTKDVSADRSESSNRHKSGSKSRAASSWKTLLKGPPAAPPCKGHKEPCVLRTVKKESVNKGRQFLGM